MSTVALVEEFEATAEVAAIFADIRATFGMPSVPAMFRAIAHHPGYLKASWERVKVIMAPGLIDRKTKEMIAVAVSAANGCDYCVQAHTAALKGMGSKDAEIVELMAVVDLFSGFNKMLEGLQVTPDIGSWGKLSASGTWAWKWKDWIDRRFMKQYDSRPESGLGGNHEPA